jgi:DNA-directed RNA polymerase specialized sigma24 family protein
LIEREANGWSWVPSEIWSSGCGAESPRHSIAWPLTVARREYLSFRRAQALDLSRLLTLGIERSHEQERANGDNAEIRALATALERLMDADREVILLSAGSGLDPAGIAQSLGIAAVALRQRLGRARRRLAQACDALEGVPRALPKGAAQSRTLPPAARVSSGRADSVRSKPA